MCMLHCCISDRDRCHSPRKCTRLLYAMAAESRATCSGCMAKAVPVRMQWAQVHCSSNTHLRAWRPLRWLHSSARVAALLRQVAAPLAGDRPSSAKVMESTSWKCSPLACTCSKPDNVESDDSVQ